MTALPQQKNSPQGLRLLNVASSVDPAAGGISSRFFVSAGRSSIWVHEVETVTVDAPDSASEEKSPVAGSFEGSAARAAGILVRFRPVAEAKRRQVRCPNFPWTLAFQFACRTSCRPAGQPAPTSFFRTGCSIPWFQAPIPGQAPEETGFLVDMSRIRSPARCGSRSCLRCEEERFSLARSSFWPYRCVERVVPLGTSEPPQNRDEQLKGCLFGCLSRASGDKRVTSSFWAAFTRRRAAIFSCAPSWSSCAPVHAKNGTICT